MSNFFRFSPPQSVFIPGLNHIRAIEWQGDPTVLEGLEPYQKDYKIDFETEPETGDDMIVITCTSQQPNCETLAYRGDYILNLAGHLTVLSSAIFTHNFKKAGHYDG